MCARVGNQRSCGVVTARVRTNAVRSLRHQRRDLHQSTYPYLSEDRDSSYYHLGALEIYHPVEQWTRVTLTFIRHENNWRC
jgi:hypothetical protein